MATEVVVAGPYGAQHVQHSGIFLPGKTKPSENNAPQSYTDKTLTLTVEGTDESLVLGVKTSTLVGEVKEILAALLQLRDPGSLMLKRKSAYGAVVLRDTEEVLSSLILSGVKSLKRPTKQYEHPIIVVGAGLAGLQFCMELQDRGRNDFVCIERLDDFGGFAWTKVPNRYTKLQTERGTYHYNYTKPQLPVPKYFGDMPYTTWPSQNQILVMMREGAKEYGLYQNTMFNTSIEKVTAKQGAYVVQHLPANESEDDGGILMAGAVTVWPGFLHELNEHEFNGEDDFEGYIEYSSFDRTDYTQCTGKTCVVYGHGAFSIENVRTLVEQRAKKIYVVCRTRNLSGTKITSWLVGYCDFAMPATVMLESFQKMYDLVGFNVWKSSSVNTDENFTSATVTQKTIFGVTDIYFLAGYFGLMEVITEDIKRLSPGCVHTVKGTKIECDVIIKAIGTRPSFKIDKEFGIKEVVGSWINGDPLRFINLGAKGVAAKNFGSFSQGPGFAPTVKMAGYFLDYPQDMDIIRADLPRNKAGQWPAYVVQATFFLPMGMLIAQKVPMCQMEQQVANEIKARKQKQSHPPEEYLAECKAEWEGYIKGMREAGLVDDRPDPPYPYTIEDIHRLMEKAGRIQMGERISFKDVAKRNVSLAPATGPMPVGLLFPGQGSQYVNMMSDVKDIPAVKDMLERAAGILGYDILELCLQGPEARLEETRFCQPAMFIAGLAGLEKLRSESEDAATRFEVCAGLSLGEYTALCAAGVFSFEDGLRLVKLRGESMQDAAAVGKQAMLSVAGLDKATLERCCRDAARKEGGEAVCQIANELFPSGFTCAGTEAAVHALKDLAEQAGSLQAKFLKISGGFHTSLMAPAKERLGRALDELLPRMKPPRHTVVMNVSGQPLKAGTDPKEIVELLKRQLTSPVLWEPSVRSMIGMGVTEYYELGPMKQIKAMMKRIDAKVWGTTTNIEV